MGFILDEDAWTVRFRRQALTGGGRYSHTGLLAPCNSTPEWCMTCRQAERTEGPRYGQPPKRESGAFRFARTSMSRPGRTRSSASLSRDERATRLCKPTKWKRMVRLPPRHYLPRLRRDSTLHRPMCSTSICGMTLFKAATIPPIDNDLKLN